MVTHVRVVDLRSLEYACAYQALTRWGGALLELAHFRQGDEARDMIKEVSELCMLCLYPGAVGGFGKSMRLLACRLSGNWRPHCSWMTANLRPFGVWETHTRQRQACLSACHATCHHCRRYKLFVDVCCEHRAQKQGLLAACQICGLAYLPTSVCLLQGFLVASPQTAKDFFKKASGCFEKASELVRARPCPDHHLMGMVATLATCCRTHRTMCTRRQLR